MSTNKVQGSLAQGIMLIATAWASIAMAAMFWQFRVTAAVLLMFAGFSALRGLAHLVSGRTRMCIQPETETWTLAAPNAGPDQCPMCGVDDLVYWRGRQLTAPYGRFDVHAECLPLAPVLRVPVTPTDTTYYEQKMIARMFRSSTDPCQREMLWQ